MKQGEKINIEELKKGRTLDHREIIKFLSAHGAVFYSWGSHAFTKVTNSALRFKAEGHHHKGHVYIFINGADLFDVYLTTTQGKIQKVFNDIFIDGLVELLDESIEKIPEYGR